VRRFPRYHKYTLGSELRQTAQRLCRWVARANNANAEGRFAALDQLVLGLARPAISKRVSSNAH